MADRLRCLPVLRRTTAATSSSVKTCSFGSRTVISVVEAAEGELVVPIPANRHESSGFAELLNLRRPGGDRTHPFSRPPRFVALLCARDQKPSVWVICCQSSIAETPF